MFLSIVLIIKIIDRKFFIKSKAPSKILVYAFIASATKNQKTLTKFSLDKILKKLRQLRLNLDSKQGI